MLLDPVCRFLHIEGMADTQKLLARVDALASRTGASRSTLSRKLFGNGNRIEEIRAGGSLTLATYERAIRRLAELEASPTDRRTPEERAA